MKHQAERAPGLERTKADAAVSAKAHEPKAAEKTDKLHTAKTLLSCPRLTNKRDGSITSART